MYRLDLFYFLALITLIPHKYNAEYVFNVVWVKSVSSIPTSSEHRNENKLSELSLEEQWSLCRDVVERVPLDRIDSGRIFFGVEKHEIFHFDGKIEIIEALRCPTLPLSFVTEDSTDNELKIIMIDEFLSPYEFEMQTVKSISAFQNPPKDIIRKNLLHRLTPDEKLRLCNGAKMYASVVDLEPTISSEVTGYEITHLDDSVEVYIALLCATSPPLYLHSGNVKEDMKIMSEIEFLEEHYEFKTKTVESVIKCEPEDDELKKKIKKNFLSTLSGSRRWNLCVAALIRSQPRTFRLRRTKSLVKNVGVYNILDTDGRELEDIAFSCPTSREDVMFLRLGNSKNEFIVMFVKDPNSAPWVWD